MPVPIVCVFCGKARLASGHWVEDEDAPPDCDHETIEGQK